MGCNYRPVGHSDSGLSLSPGGGACGIGGIVGVGPAVSASAYRTPVAEYGKEFSTYPANDNDFKEQADNGQVVESLKKNLCVIHHHRQSRQTRCIREDRHLCAAETSRLGRFG